jgi:hypothetical protein
MTFSSRPLRKTHASVASFTFAMAGVVLLGLVAGGCEDKHIGRVCSLDTADASVPATGTSATLNGSAVECPSRICLLPANEQLASAGPLCTAGCSSDDDCGGETSSTNKAQCRTGFTCMVATTVGDFCCERLCVCKDFVNTGVKGFNATPAVCVPGSPEASLCRNVH